MTQCLQVFVHGQGVPAELELEYEDECVHFLARNSDQQPVGTGRLRDVGNYVKFERVRCCPVYMCLAMKAMQTEHH